MDNKWTRRILTILLLLFATAWLGNYLLIPLVCERVLSSHLREVYHEQSVIFTPSIASLGVTSQPIEYFNCGDEQLTRWQSKMLCRAYQNYSWNFSSISSAAKEAYPRNAAKFDELLRENGWTSDRPQDRITSLAESNPDLPSNGGIGGEVSFHKNIGHGKNFISCNLQIDVQGYQSGIAAEPAWTINVNEFSCDQHIHFLAFHLQNYQYHGV